MIVFDCQRVIVKVPTDRFGGISVRFGPRGGESPYEILQARPPPPRTLKRYMVTKNLNINKKSTILHIILANPESKFSEVRQI